MVVDTNREPLPTWPEFTPSEIVAVEKVLRSGRVNYWTGDETKKFEKEYARSLNLDYGVAVSNGTVALELALRAIGVESGDEVIVTPRSFVASANSIVLCGGVPVFADVDPVSGNMTSATMSKVMTKATRAAILVHLGGFPCEMDEIMELSREAGFSVIEDCAQAHGAKYRGQPVGGIGAIGCFSFCQDKIISTGGEGGLVATRSEDLWRKMWAFKDHGKSYSETFERDHAPGFRWLHTSFGTNMRMTEVQAVIGRIQLDQLEQTVGKRNENASVMRQYLNGISGVRIPEVADHFRHSYYRFYAYIRSEKLRTGWSRDRIMNLIIERGGKCFSGSCSEIYLEESFKETGFRPAARLPVARELGETSLAFPVHHTLQRLHMNRLGEIAAEVLTEASL